MRDARSLIYDRMLDIPSLIYRFSDAGDRNNRHWQGFRRHALCLCMLSHFLFASGSVRLIEVTQGLKEGKSCVVMTLAEILMGLDTFYRRETTRFVGSPLLLQVKFPTQSHMCTTHAARPSNSFSHKILFSLFLSSYISLFFILSFFIPSQVWLMDKLQVVDSCPAYSALGYFFRQRLVDALDEGWWFD